MVDEPVQRLGERIVAVRRDAVGRESHAIGGVLALGLGLAHQDARRIADRRGAWRHLAQHHGVGADARAVADRERPHHLRAGADDHVATERRMALGALRERRAAERHALVDGRVVADLGGLADHHAEAMVDEHAPADRAPGGSRCR